MFFRKRIEYYCYPVCIGAGALFSFLLWFLAIWRFKVAQDFVSLHYTVYFGLDRFGPKHDLFLFPALGTVLLLLNAAVIRYVLEESKLWQGIVMGLTVLMEIALLASFILTTLKDIS